MRLKLRWRLSYRRGKVKLRLKRIEVEVRSGVAIEVALQRKLRLILV